MSFNVAQQFVGGVVEVCFRLLSVQVGFLVGEILGFFWHLVCLNMDLLLPVLHCHVV